MAGRIVVFGATGYTGRLAAEALVARGQRPVLAGRGAERLEALAGELGGLQWRIADAGDPASVRALLEPGDVLVSTVGPFGRFGAAALDAAVGAGAHYLDSTGEAVFIRRVFERDGPRAAGARCALLTAFGFDYVPGNLAGALALGAAGERATAVAIGYFSTGGSFAASGGTRASIGGVALDRSFAFASGALHPEPTARRVRSFDLRPGKRGMGVSVGGSEHFALPRLADGLRDVEVDVGWFGALSGPVSGLARAADAAFRLPGVRAGARALAQRFLHGSTGGPDADQRARSGSLVIAEVRDATGAVLATVRLAGPNPYDFTAEALAWGAGEAAAGHLRDVGALGPVDAFGLEELRTGMQGIGLRQDA
jgi:short subunit dehydrogenase-like uncharacterized protein